MPAAPIERILLEQKHRPRKDICHAILDYALKQEDYPVRIGEPVRIDDKTAFIVKHD
jgi:hypothetical protein